MSDAAVGVVGTLVGAIVGAVIAPYIDQVRRARLAAKTARVLLLSMPVLRVRIAQLQRREEPRQRPALAIFEECRTTIIEGFPDRDAVDLLMFMTEAQTLLDRRSEGPRTDLDSLVNYVQVLESKATAALERVSNSYPQT